MLVMLLLAAPATMARSTLTANPLGLIVGVISVEYETDFNSLDGPFTLTIPAGLVSFRALGITGFNAGAGLRYYLDGRTHDGFYVGGGGDWSLLSVSDGVDRVSIHVVGLNATGGYKWMLDSVVVDAGLGINIPLFASATSQGTNLGSAAGFGGVGIGPRVAVGIEF